MAVPIKKSVLSQQVHDGMKKKALAEFYELPVAQMTQVLKDAGLTIRKFHAPKYVLEDDTAEEEARQLEIQEDINTGEDEAISQDTEEGVQQEEEVVAVSQDDVPNAGW